MSGVTPEQEQQRLLGGRYRLQHVVGRGGMGTVWAGVDELLGRPVAVKEVLPPPNLSAAELEDLRRRTLEEARAAARISSPAAVTVHDVVEENGHPWIVMELLASRTLADVLQERTLSPQEAATLGLAILSALRAAESAGVLHRDVKPANVMFRGRGDDMSRAVLTDFGVARFVGDPHVTATGTLVGSPAYVAPERATGHPATFASDLWSLGVTLWAAVEGRPPFAREGALPTLTAIVTEKVPKPQHAGPLTPVFRGLLRKDPARRTGAEQLRRQLQAVAGRAESARAAPAPAAAATPAPAASPPRRRAGALVTGLVALLLAAAAAAAFFLLLDPFEGDRQSARPDDGGTAAGTAPVAPEPSTPPASTPTSSPPAPSPTAEVPATEVPATAGPTTEVPATEGPTTETPTPESTAPTSGGTEATAEPPPGSGAGSDSAPPAPASNAQSPDGSPAEPPPAAAAPAAQSGAPPGFVLHQDPTGFTVAVPQGWTLDKPYPSAVRFNDPNSGASLLIDQTDDPKSDAVADWRAQEQRVSGNYTDYQRVGEIEGRTLRGWEAADWEFTYATSGGRGHKLNRNLITTPGEQAYALLWTTSDDQWAQRRGVFDTIFASFQPRQ